MPGGRGERMSQCLGMVPPPGLKGQPQRPRGPPSGTRPARGLLRARTTCLGPHQTPGLNIHFGRILTCKLGISWKLALPGTCVKAECRDTT